MAYVRVQVLLEPGQHKALQEAAQRENVSVSELIRRAVDGVVHWEDNRRAWLADARALSSQIMERRKQLVDVDAILDASREDLERRG